MTNLAYTDYEEEYDEFDPDEINSPDYVDYYFRRKADWEKRIENLYADIKGWLPEGVYLNKPVFPTHIGADNFMKIFEPQLRNKAINFAILSNLKAEEFVKCDSQAQLASRIATIFPDYQWVMGNNGELSFTTHDRAVRYKIIDRSDKKKYDFNPPSWVLSTFREKYIEVPFTKKTFNFALEEMRHATIK